MPPVSVLHCASAGESFGEVLRVREVGGFLLRESRFAPDLRIPEHRHPGFYFAFTVSGAMTESTPDGASRYRAGSLHLHPVGEPHSGITGPEGLHSLSIVPPAALASRLPNDRAAVQGRRSTALAMLAARCRREMRASDTASELALESAALELVATWLREGRTPARAGAAWLAAVRDHLHAHRTERVRLATLAALAGVHAVHLVRAFRRQFGATPGAYQRRLRIDDARRRMLESPGSALAEIALDAGFANQAHFGRVFRALVGESPAAYRRAQLALRRRAPCA